MRYKQLVKDRLYKLGDNAGPSPIRVPNDGRSKVSSYIPITLRIHQLTVPISFVNA